VVRTVTLGFGVSRAPVRGRKRHAPEVRRGVHKCDTYFWDCIALSYIHHGAVDLLIRGYVVHLYLLSDQHRFAELNQGAVRVDDLRYGPFGKWRIVRAHPGNQDWNRKQDALAPPLLQLRTWSMACVLTVVPPACGFSPA
jgi:hypothetical protein